MRLRLEDCEDDPHSLVRVQDDVDGAGRCGTVRTGPTAGHAQVVYQPASSSRRGERHRYPGSIDRGAGASCVGFRTVDALCAQNQISWRRYHAVSKLSVVYQVSNLDRQRRIWKVGGSGHGPRRFEQARVTHAVVAWGVSPRHDTVSQGPAVSVTSGTAPSKVPGAIVVGAWRIRGVAQYRSPGGRHCTVGSDIEVECVRPREVRTRGRIVGGTSGTGRAMHGDSEAAARPLQPLPIDAFFGVRQFNSTRCTQRTSSTIHGEVPR